MRTSFPSVVAPSHLVRHAAAAALGFLAACGGGDSTAPCAVSAITVAPNTASLRTGGTSQHTATLDASNCTTAPTVLWSTGDAGVATVSNTGLVTAVAAGATTISATVGSVSGAVNVTVTAAVATVSTSLSQSVVFVGTTLRPVATASTRAAGGTVVTGRTVTWSSTNTAVATVDSSTGVVTPVAVGTANIRATSEGITGQSAFTVSAMPTANNRFGFAWNQLPAAPVDSVYSPLSLYTANASGGAVTIRRTAAGAYTVRFDGAANVAGITMSDVVMVTAYGAPSVQCSTLQWSASNVTDLDVLVRCSDLSGTATNASFNVALIGSGSLGGKFGFAWTPTTTGGAVNALYSFSTGVAPTHTRTGLGTYSLTFGTGAITAGSHVLVSTYGAADRGCWVGSWASGSATSGFQCAQSSDNTLADSRFVALMLEAGRTDKRWAYAWNSDPASALNTAYTPDVGYQRQSNGQRVTVTAYGGRRLRGDLHRIDARGRTKRHHPGPRHTVTVRSPTAPCPRGALAARA